MERALCKTTNRATAVKVKTKVHRKKKENGQIYTVSETESKIESNAIVEAKT